MLYKDKESLLDLLKLENHLSQLKLASDHRVVIWEILSNTSIPTISISYLSSHLSISYHYICSQSAINKSSINTHIISCCHINNISTKLYTMNKSIFLSCYNMSKYKVQFLNYLT